MQHDMHIVYFCCVMVSCGVHCNKQLVSCAVCWQSTVKLMWHLFVCWVSTKLFTASKLASRASEAQLHMI